MDSTFSVQRHPLLIDHETQQVMDLRPGETLYSFLHRHIDNLDGQQLVVQVGDKIVPRHLWFHMRVKDGVGITVRNTVHRTALLIVAMIVLTVFTMGAAAVVAGTMAAGTFGTALATGLAAMGLTGTAAMAAIGAIQVVGAMVINKVLGPKPPKPQAIDRDNVYSLNATRNASRQYEPAGLLFGSVRVTPDVISMPYHEYRGNDQYLSMVLSPGVNVSHYDELYLGDTPLSTYQNVQVWHSGFGGMPDQDIPVKTNANSIAGATLDPNVAVIRTSSPDALMLQVDISFLLFDVTSKGKPKDNQETVVVEYRRVGDSTWQSFGTYNLVSRKQSEVRRSFTKTVEAGQYEVSVRRLGLDTDGSGATCEFNFTLLTTFQKDEATYAGLSRIAVTMLATGQLNGAPDELRAIMHASPIPVWNGTEWITATDRASGLSNAAANTLKYLRGYYDRDGNLIAGMGLPDAQIDVESFKDWMVYCTLMEFDYDAWITGDRNHEEMLQALGLAGMGGVTFAPGRATAVWAAEGQPVSAIVNMATIKKSSFQLDYSLIPSADGIEYTYFDRETMQTATLRVAAPGVTDMLNPATITGEGITSETHAAILARFHMAQMIYQSKDISYSTDLEHMAYGQMSVIELQHDLTQWGYGGRLSAISTAGGITLTLDDEVPPPPSGNAYIGVRVPGELTYRVFEVQPFSSPSNTISLVGAWPAGVPVPNPAHDAIWIYDFKQTPGLRCRVVAMAPESDLGGAQVSVVPESDEYWNYIISGEYVPPKSGSLLQTAPILNNLHLQSEQIVQGDTTRTRINASWGVASGNAAGFVISAGRQGQASKEVWRGTERAAEWEIDEPGIYTVSVRGIGPLGNPGPAVSGIVNSAGSDAPPVLVDVFDVTELEGGMRRYDWGFLETTIRSPDFVGVEIRYKEGAVSSPDWDGMLPVGNGYYTSAFDSPLPVAGTYTFAIRSMNSAGVLSATQLTLIKTLSGNLGEIIGGLDPGAITEQLVELQLELEQERVDRFNADAANAQQAADDLLAQAQAQNNALAAEVAARQAAVALQRVRIDQIDDDEIISQGEKPQLRIDVQSIKDVYPRLRAQMVLAEAHAAVATLDEAYDNLMDKLDMQVSPVKWDDTSDITYIV